MQQQSQFEIIGYFVEYYKGKKYLGSRTLEEKDREHFGSKGRRKEKLDRDINLKGRKLSAGTEVETALFPINGKMKKM